MIIYVAKFVKIVDAVVQGAFGELAVQCQMLDGVGRVRNVIQGPDGFVYVGVEGVGIVKLVQN